MRLEGKVAIITGGANGMGAEECRILAREGAKVVIADVMEDEGRQVEAEIAESGGDAVFMRLDVTDEDNWNAVVADTVARFGKLDILVNNAGISGSHNPDTMSTEAWDTFMDINAKGVFLGMKCAIPKMKNAGGGSIVNISSISGIVGQQGNHMGYNASKGAVRIVTKSAAVQYAQDGIRVNSVHPGVMPPMRSSSAARNPDAPSPLLDHVPMRRVGLTSEVGNAVLFLASDEASYITGAELVVDGGLTAT
ncbi:MAG: glucose 1-dehydrogenase [Chloroflexi bacterium]|nr:glucose 1-dehydrogenase [Chloroflexota bacterium]